MKHKRCVVDRVVYDSKHYGVPPGGGQGCRPWVSAHIDSLLAALKPAAGKGDGRSMTPRRWASDRRHTHVLPFGGRRARQIDHEDPAPCPCRFSVVGVRVLLTESASLTCRETLTVVGRGGGRADVVSSGRWTVSRFSRWRGRSVDLPPPVEDPVGYLRALGVLSEH